MHSGAYAMLYVFEDNEAVIRTIIKGRSPTMRHVSRTHRVALDWLFDRINLDPKIPIKYVDTKNQLADMLTRGSFTRDEWDHLLRLLNISNFSSLRCTRNFSLISCNTVPKKEFRNKKEGERVVSKSRPVMNVSSSLFATSSSAASSPIASKSPGMSGASGKPGSRMNLEASSLDAASTSQLRLKDAHLGGLKEEQQGNLTHEREQISEESDDSVPWYHKPVAQTDEACGKPLAGETAESSPVIQKSQNNKEATWKSCLQLSIPTHQFTSDVFSMFREIYGKDHDESMSALTVLLAFWRRFMYTTPQTFNFCRQRI